MADELKEMQAIGRLSNPFIYKSDIVYAGLGLASLDAYLNLQGMDGWKLHTIERMGDGDFFCVWEKLDYGSKGD